MFISTIPNLIWVKKQIYNFIPSYNSLYKNNTNDQYFEYNFFEISLRIKCVLYWKNRQTSTDTPGIHLWQQRLGPVQFVWLESD